MVLALNIYKVQYENSAELSVPSAKYVSTSKLHLATIQSLSFSSYCARLFERCSSQRWIGRTGPNDMVYALWPPWSPDLTSCDFFHWGYVKDRVYLPSLPVDLPDLKRIAAAIESITPDMLNNVWEKFDYRLHVCHVTNGAHIEHL